jgi:hypothetical protein
VREFLEGGSGNLGGAEMASIAGHADDENEGAGAGAGEGEGSAAPGDAADAPAGYADILEALAAEASARLGRAAPHRAATPRSLTCFCFAHSSPPPSRPPFLPFPARSLARSQVTKLRAELAQAKGEARRLQGDARRGDAGRAEAEAERDRLRAEREAWLAQIAQFNEALQAVFKEARASKEKLMAELAALSQERGTVEQLRASFAERERALLAAVAAAGGNGGGGGGGGGAAHLAHAHAAAKK